MIGLSIAIDKLLKRLGCQKLLNRRFSKRETEILDVYSEYFSCFERMNVALCSISMNSNTINTKIEQIDQIISNINDTLYKNKKSEEKANTKSCSEIKKQLGKITDSTNKLKYDKSQIDQYKEKMKTSFENLDFDVLKMFLNQFGIKPDSDVYQDHLVTFENMMNQSEYKKPIWYNVRQNVIKLLAIEIKLGD